MAQTTQITETAASRPGVLARVPEAFATASVDIVALCAGASAGRRKIRLVVSDPPQVRETPAAARIRRGEEPTLLLSMADRPGALAGVASKLAAAGIDITCAHATTAGAGKARAVVVVANADKAERPLG